MTAAEIQAQCFAKARLDAGALEQVTRYVLDNPEVAAATAWANYQAVMATRGASAALSNGLPAPAWESLTASQRSAFEKRVAALKAARDEWDGY